MHRYTLLMLPGQAGWDMTALLTFYSHANEERNHMMKILEYVLKEAPGY